MSIGPKKTKLRNELKMDSLVKLSMTKSKN